MSDYKVSWLFKVFLNIEDEMSIAFHHTLPNDFQMPKGKTMPLL